MKPELCGHSPSRCGGRQSDYCTFLPLSVNVFRGDYRCDPDKRANSLVLSDWLSVVGQRIDPEVLMSTDTDNHIVAFINTLGWNKSKSACGVILGLWSPFSSSFSCRHVHHFINTLGKSSFNACHAVKWKAFQLEDVFSLACTEAHLCKECDCVFM